jgi:iron complex outermembrane receptor protein
MPHPATRTSIPRLTLRPLAFALRLMVVGGCVAGALQPMLVAAQAQTATHEFDLAPGPLAATLNRIGDTAGLLLSFDPALVKDRSAGAVKGRLSAAQAFAAALSGSGLAAITEGGAVVIRAVPASAPNPPEALLPSVKVTASRDIALRADHAPATTKGQTPLLATPVSVQVIPQALIDDRQANTLREALQTISGVFPGATSLHEDVIVRGFYVDQSYRNGVRTFRFGPTEIANAERVDVLKGPSSTQFGRGDVSGTFNVVTKKPELEGAAYSLNQQVGTDRFRQTTVDATGPIDPERALAYRVIGSYEDSGSFRDRVSTRRGFLAPSLSWAPSAATRVNIELELARHDSPIDRGVPADGDRPANVPRSRNFSEADAFHVNRSNILALDWRHRLDDTWTLRQNLMFERGDGHGLEYQQARAVDFGIDAPGVLLRLPRRIRERDVATGYTSVELAGTPSHGSIRHDLVVGFDIARNRRTFDFLEAALADIEALDIYDFVPTGAAPAATEPSVQRRNLAKSWGVYVQDQIQLSSQWNLMVGGRYDDAREESIDRLTGDSSQTRDKRFSPRVGLVRALDEHTSVYGSYTESFSQANGRRADGSAMKPITATQHELGFKAESANKRVFTTLALYALTKQNIVVPDPADSSNSVQLGRARSRGFEWDLGGRITPQWNLTGSYSYTDARITRDTDATKVGRRLYGVPKHGAKVFARYDQMAGGAVGWTAGAGLVALGRQFGDVENTFHIPGYVRLDAMTGYKWATSGGQRLTVQLNIENLGDRTYYLPSGGAAEIAFGKPRTFMASFRAEF